MVRHFLWLALLAGCATDPAPLHPFEPKILALEESRCRATGDCVPAARAHADGVGGIRASRARAVALLELGCEQKNRPSCLKLYQVTCEKSALLRACADERPDFPQCAQLGKHIRQAGSATMCGPSTMAGLTNNDLAAAEQRQDPRLDVYYTSRLLDELGSRCTGNGDKASCRRRDWWNGCEWNDDPLPCGSNSWPPVKKKPAEEEEEEP